jgi:hypothetical protein
VRGGDGSAKKTKEEEVADCLVNSITALRILFLNGLANGKEDGFEFTVAQQIIVTRAVEGTVGRKATYPGMSSAVFLMASKTFWQARMS